MAAIVGYMSRILMIGPSRAGKTYLTNIFRQHGLDAFDIEKEPGIIGWYDDANGRPILHKPNPPTKEWFATHHFLMDKQAMDNFLAVHPDCIIFVHCWNIMECLDLFDEVYFMYLSPEEIERRMKIERSDHQWQGSEAEVTFMKERHAQRFEQVNALGIPKLDVSRPGEEIYQSFLSLRQKTLRS
jgi:hypothetical protein